MIYKFHCTFDVVYSSLTFMHIREKQECINKVYHRLTREYKVLTGRNAPILRQDAWKYEQYFLRAFPCLSTFLLRQNCFAPAADAFSSDFWFLSRRRANARQGEKDKKRRTGAAAGLFALVNRWYSLLNPNGRFVLSIDKSQNEYIEYGNRKIDIYPDNPTDTKGYIINSGLTILDFIEIEFAYIFVGLKA